MPFERYKTFIISLKQVRIVIGMFQGIEVEDNNLTLKSLSVTRWSYRWEAMKAVVEQMPRIIKALLTLSVHRDPKTYTDSNALLNSICDFKFIFGLVVLRVILSNTYI